VNNRILLSALSFLAVAGFASGTTQVSKKRLDAIWAAVDDRITSQTSTWFDDGDYPKSINLLVFQTTYAPNDYEAVTNLGWMQENVEEWDEALATYKLYFKNNPNDKERAYPEAYFLFSRKQYAGIPALLEPVLKFRPHPDDYRVLAHTYEKLRKYQDAKRVWQMYLALAPDDGAAKMNLARDEKRIADSKTR
jgi:tetratricopeptide (TPR) repeat protein